MSYFPSYVKGDWAAICDECGFKFKASCMQLRWDGAFVDSKCFEERQPQDFIKGISGEMLPVPIIRTEPPDHFVEE